MSEDKKAKSTKKGTKKITKKVEKSKSTSKASKKGVNEEVISLETSPISEDLPPGPPENKKKGVPNIAPIPEKFTERRGKTGKKLPPLTAKKTKIMNVDTRGVINEVTFADDEQHLKELAILAGYRVGEPNSSIFGRADFPPVGNVNWKFTPKDVLKAIVLFSSTTKGLMECLELCGVDYFRYLTLVRKNYPIVEQIEGVCAKTRAHLFNEQANKVFNTEIPEDAYEITAYGKRLMPAWTAYMIAKAKHFEGQAKVNERRSYNKEKESNMADINIEVSVGTKFTLDFYSESHRILYCAV
jgi:hypothetical protein